VISRLSQDYEAVIDVLETSAERIRSRGEIPFPNPMGLTEAT